jgi:hypothetical protein
MTMPAASAVGVCAIDAYESAGQANPARLADGDSSGIPNVAQ